MKRFLHFLGLTVASVSAFQLNLSVKFTVGLVLGTDYFFDVPRSVNQAIWQGWSITDRPSESPRASLVLYCPTDYTVCALYDDNDIIAGLQISVPQDEFSDAIFNWQVQGYADWVLTTPAGYTKKYWAIQQYFVSEEYLQLDADVRRAQYDNTKLLQEDAVWLTGFHGEVDEVLGKTSDIENSIFTRQACIPHVGRHFYYNMSESTPCQADTMYPWFLLMHSGELIGTGLDIFGKLPVKYSHRDWFERPSRQTIMATVPDGPECLYDLASYPGVVTIHTYFINNPNTLECAFN